jgi:hypothetical protein
MFARGIVGILESDGCNEGRIFCDGDNELDGVIDRLEIGLFVGHCIVNALIDGK